MHASNPVATTYGLVDGAQYHQTLHAHLKAHAVPIRFLFEGLPEEAAKEAGPMLFALDPFDTPWVQSIDVMDRHRPCWTVIRSEADMGSLQHHLQHFLFADIGDGMQAMLRWFDPRSLPTLLKVGGKQFREQITAPMLSWQYRDVYARWIELLPPPHRPSAVHPLDPVSLNQAQIDAIEHADARHVLLSDLVDAELIDPQLPYHEKYERFEPIHERALKWGLSDQRDLLVYCSAACTYGESMDQEPHIQAAIRACVSDRTPLDVPFKRLPAAFWTQLLARRQRSESAS